ncbi:MAG: hypothetical protein ACK4OK_09970 [Thermoflexus sp.]
MFWDERDACFRLPLGLPAGTILVFPIGFILLTAVRIRQLLTEKPDWLSLLSLGVWLSSGFYPLLLLYLRPMLKAWWKSRRFENRQKAA